MKKKIWIMNHYAGHMLFDRGGRHYNFAKYLKQSGYEPVVFCANSKHNAEGFWFENAFLWQEHRAEEIDVPFVYVAARSYVGNGKQRVLNMVDFYRHVKKTAKEYAKQHGRPDVIYASSVHPLTLVAGLQLAKYFGVKCICEARDLWPESIVVLSKRLTKTNPVIRLLYQGEKWIYKKADELIFTMQGGYEYIEERGWEKAIPRHKVHYINNGVDLEQFDRNREQFLMDDPDLNDPATFKVVYAGAIRPANNLGLLLDCAEALLPHRNIRFLVYGNGESLEELRALCEERKVTNCVFKGAVPKTAIPYILSKSDLNLLNYDRKVIELFRYGSSNNKLFEYLASGKPVLSNTVIKYSVFRQYQCGWEKKLTTAAEYADAVLEVAQLPTEEYEACCANARRAAQEYDFKFLTQKLIGVIEKA